MVKVSSLYSPEKYALLVYEIELPSTDHAQRSDFTNWVTDRQNVNADFVDRIIFEDEAYIVKTKRIPKGLLFWDQCHLNESLKHFFENGVGDMLTPVLCAFTVRYYFRPEWATTIFRFNT